jgi:hypothetical protein
MLRKLLGWDEPPASFESGTQQLALGAIEYRLRITNTTERLNWCFSSAIDNSQLSTKAIGRLLIVHEKKNCSEPSGYQHRRTV